MSQSTENLKQILSQEDTILFIGSGISRWSGLPSWPGMIEKLAEYLEFVGENADLVRSELRKGELLQAASYGFDRLTKHQIGDFIRASCHFGTAKPHDIHRKIVSLGPRCFVTTNYDDLLEQSLRIWQPERFFRPPVTNRHLTETAAIVNARAVDFIFKPHGDAADSESIILTREQYRQLVPPGERQAALESLKMLMASRPIVYLGFGLRDPDFMYVRDLLANTYRGGVRDHYAIMADVSDPERDYWRRNYGIHLISYTTTARHDGIVDHSNLLGLLDGLLEEQSSPKSVGFDPQAPDTLLTLARYAAGLARSPKLDPEFVIRVGSRTGTRRTPHFYASRDRFDSWTVEKFLDEGPQRCLLIGLPGAGKTYALRRAAARASERLHDMCLAESFDHSQIVIPIFVDLKLYRGSLNDLVNETLPPSLSLTDLVKHFVVKFFIDSFNEMPREYWDNATYESDFATFASNIRDGSLIIGSRTLDGLTKLGFPEYYLDQIDIEAVTAELQKLGMDPAGLFQREVKTILQRPFYFRYVTTGKVRLPTEPHPRDFYRSWFDNLRRLFESRFSTAFDIEKSLSIAAYEALNRGEEAFPLSELLAILNNSLRESEIAIDRRDVANWLVAQSTLIPHTGGRVAFVHQSATEYLAATELARRYQATPQVLKEKLALTRWDQALFLTLSLLPASYAEQFLADVIQADFLLALSAVKYIEVSRDEVVATLLAKISSLQSTDELAHQVSLTLRSDLPISASHEYQLRELLRMDGLIGGAAAVRLVELKGQSVKEELLPLLFERRNDFNFCGSLGHALLPFAVNDDVEIIATWADLVMDAPPLLDRTGDYVDDSYSGFTRGAATFLSHIEIPIVWQAFIPSDASTPIPKVHGNIMCAVLQTRYSTAALELTGQLLLRDCEDAAYSLYFISEHADPPSNLSWTSFNSRHVEKLEIFLLESNDNWALPALKNVCIARPDLAKIVIARANERSGFEKALLLHCAFPTEPAHIFKALEGLIELTEGARRSLPLKLLDDLDLDWTGRENLFLEILRTRDERLASAVLGNSIPVRVENLGILEIGPIDWWLQWILEVPSEVRRWFAEQLGSLFGQHLAPEKQSEFIAEFNNPTSKFRRVLQHYILVYFSELTTDSFTEDTISFLLADLNTKNIGRSLHGHLLALTATEQFIVDRLMPILPDAMPTLDNNLRQVIRQAGARHGHRYLLDSF